MADALFPLASPADPSWHRYTTAEPGDGPATAVVYGTELPTEAELKLLGPVEGRRVLDLGCGAGRNATVLAQQGAKVLAVDPSAEVVRSVVWDGAVVEAGERLVDAVRTPSSTLLVR